MATSMSAYILARYMRPKLRLALTKPEPTPQKWFFLYMNDFEATRRFLEALKTAGNS